MRLTFPAHSTHPSLDSMSSTGGTSVSCAFLSLPMPAALRWTRKCGYPAHPHSMSPGAKGSIDGIRFGRRGSWTTSSRIRNYISLVTQDTVQSTTEKTRTKFRYAPHLPKLESALAALTSHYYRSGTDDILFFWSSAHRVFTFD